MKYILIDDEELAKTRLKTLIDECNLGLEFLGAAENAMEGIKLIHSSKPDIVFLDIQMPQINGFELLDLLPKDVKTQIIFVTAYDEFALQAFEAHAVDYLLKPVKKARLETSLKRIIEQKSPQTADELKEKLGLNASKTSLRMAVQHKQETLLLPIDHVVWIESRETLTFVHTRDGNQYRCDKTLDELELRMPDFFRLHRSYLAPLHHIVKLIPWFNGAIKVELINGIQLDVAKRRVAELKKALGV